MPFCLLISQISKIKKESLCAIMEFLCSQWASLPFFFFFKQIELNVDEMMAYERLDCSDRPFKIHFPLWLDFAVSSRQWCSTASFIFQRQSINPANQSLSCLIRNDEEYEQSHRSSCLSPNMFVRRSIKHIISSHTQTHHECGSYLRQNTTENRY